MPNENVYTGNYIGKNLNQIGLTQELETTVGAGINTQTILGVGDKYMIDLYGSLQTHRPEETPMLTIMENLGSQSVNAPYFVWTDEYKGTSWWDTGLDNLRTKDTVPGSGGDISIPLSGFGAKFSATSMPIPMTSDNYVGGFLDIKPIASLPSSPNIIVPGTVSGNSITMTKLTTGAPGGGTLNNILNSHYVSGNCWAPNNGKNGVVAFCFKKNNDNTVGQIEPVWNRLRNLLVNVGYYCWNVATATGELLFYGDTNNPVKAMAPVYMAFPTLTVASTNNAGSTVTRTIYNQVLARIHSVYYGNLSGSDNYLAIALDFTDSNTPLTAADLPQVNLGAAFGTNVISSIQISLPYINGTPTFSAYTAEEGEPNPKDATYASITALIGWNGTAWKPDIAREYAGIIDRMIMLGSPTVAPYGIPEGDKFTPSGNLTAGRERMMNFTQIFASPSYGITGTTQASSFRFENDFQTTRDLYFTLYKKQMQAAFMYGIKGETVVSGFNDSNYTNNFVKGQPIRTTGGLMDYALHPIRYMRMPLPNVTWSSTLAEYSKFIEWLDRLADSLAAFRQQGTKSLTFLCSQNFCNKLNRYTRLITNEGAIMGGAVQLQKPSQLSFGLQYYQYESSSGILVKFIHDPGMDNTPSINVPKCIFGQIQIPPRDLLISIDPQNMRRMVLRPDKIYGNIQDPGQDAFLEAMRGESGFQLRFPQNHAIVWVPAA